MIDGSEKAPPKTAWRPMEEALHKRMKPINVVSDSGVYLTAVWNEIQERWDASNDRGYQDSDLAGWAPIPDFDLGVDDA